MLGRVITVANQKGGVGKTTTAVSLGSELAERHRVLLIDLDPQANATSSLGLAEPSRERSTYDVLLGDATLADIIVSTDVPGLDLAPADQALSGAQVELVDVPDREHVLARALDMLRDTSSQPAAPTATSRDLGCHPDAPVALAPADSPVADDAVGPRGPYDLILIDTPPSLGLLTLNALAASDHVMIPVQSEYLALEGLGQLIETLELVRGSLNPRLMLVGILLTMLDARTNLSMQVAAEVRRHFPAAAFRTTIPRTVRLSEAPSFGRPIQLYDPTSRGARAYAELADELLARLGQSGAAVPAGVHSA
jgi:chromosome partitioning protein